MTGGLGEKKANKWIPQKDLSNCVSENTKKLLALHKKQVFVNARAAKVSLQGQFTQLY